MGAIDRLGLDRGIPPGIKYEHVVGGGQVQPLTTRLQADPSAASDQSRTTS
jgi:hypothetical protein